MLQLASCRTAAALLAGSGCGSPCQAFLTSLWGLSCQYSWLPAGLLLPCWPAALLLCCQTVRLARLPCCQAVADQAGSDLHAVCLPQLLHEWLQLIQLVIHAL